MSIIGIAQDIMMVMKVIHVVTLQIKYNKEKSRRLSDRLNSIIPTLELIIADPSKAMCSPERLKDLLDYINEIKNFIEKFNKTSYLEKAFKIGGDEKAFRELTEGFQARVDALQFNIQVNAELQRKEDAQDSEEDLNLMKNMMSQILINQGVQAEEVAKQMDQFTKLTQNMMSQTNDLIIQGNAEIMNYLQSLKSGNLSNLPALKTITHEQLEYDQNDPDSLLGEGGFGSIYKGTYHGLKVAIKMIKSTKITREMKEELRKEALTMQML